MSSIIKAKKIVQKPTIYLILFKFVKIDLIYSSLSARLDKIKINKIMMMMMMMMRIRFSNNYELLGIYNFRDVRTEWNALNCTFHVVGKRINILGYTAILGSFLVALEI